MAVVASALGAAPAGAHTEVQRASPAPAQEVTGVVDHVELTYLDPVRADVRITVVDDAGEPVAGLGQARVAADGRTARVGFRPLEASGGYVVEHTFTALDGDQQRETYRFTYRPSARAPSASPDDDDAGWPVRIAVVGALGVVVVAATALLRARRIGRAD